MVFSGLKPTKKRQVIKHSALDKVNWADFHEHVKDLTSTHPSQALKSAGSDRRILERLGLLFWIHGEMLERGMYKHWKERRGNAEVLLNAHEKVIEAADKLIFEEAWIQTRFEVCGTGRHAAKDIGVDSIDYILNLYRLIEVLNQLKPTLMELRGKRKLLIKDDQNLFLYLMAAFCRLQGHLWHREHLSAAAIHREIATLVEAWRVSLGSKDEILDEKEVGRRIDRFRLRNKDAAGLIDSNPPKFILHFLDTSSGQSFRAGLRQDQPARRPI
jgi:hypothetical protein